MVETRRREAVILYKRDHKHYNIIKTLLTYLTLRTRGIWISDYQYVVKMKRTNSKISTETQDLQVKLLTQKGKVPTRSISVAAGYDLYI